MNNRPRPPSRASTLASQDGKISDARHAALSGATKAFGRPAPQQRPLGRAYTGANGALAATATGGSRPGSPQRRLARSPAPPLVASSTGGSVRSVQSDALRAGRVPNLQPPEQQMRQHSKSPSFQAASLAASRATPKPQQVNHDNAKNQSARSIATPRPAAPPKPRRLSEQHNKIPIEQEERPTDDTPIPPTTSLVNLFERKESQSQPSSRPEPIVIKPDASLTIKSPKPIRTSGGLTSMFQMELPETKDRAASHDGSSVSAPDRDSSPDSFTSASGDATASGTPETIITSRAAFRSPLLPENSTPRNPTAKQRPPSPPPARNVAAKPVPMRPTPSRSSTATSQRLSPSSASLISLPAQYNQLHPRGRPPPMTGDQLADAMVASSLASSRVSSPQHTEAPALPNRQRNFTFAFSRTPSPRKGMRHTLRKTGTDSESDDEDLLHPYGKHKKKRHLRPKHPNKHNEGNRKRWRDAVTERERKRYEGVWAANKGLHCSFSRPEQSLIDKSPSSEHALALQTEIGDQVSSIVARDIWSRSKLPNTTLETVWDLVDEDCVGRLSKDEFVVGLFLIDYCLKGRKLPVKVGESVWASVRGLQGIKIRK